MFRYMPCDTMPPNPPPMERITQAQRYRMAAQRYHQSMNDNMGRYFGGEQLYPNTQFYRQYMG